MLITSVFTIGPFVPCTPPLQNPKYASDVNMPSQTKWRNVGWETSTFFIQRLQTFFFVFVTFFFSLLTFFSGTYFTSMPWAVCAEPNVTRRVWQQPVAVFIKLWKQGIITSHITVAKKINYHTSVWRRRPVKLVSLFVEILENSLTRLGLATVPLCRGKGTPFDEHRRPLAPSKFLTCALRRKILLSLWPLAYAPGRDDY